MTQNTGSGRSTGRGSTDIAVLFVDDEPFVLQSYAAMFEDEYDVRTARSGEEALRAFDDHVDVAFLDRRMTGMSGDELLEAIRREGYETPVVMVTAVTEDVDLDAECDGYLQKPIRSDDIHSIVDEHTE